MQPTILDVRPAPGGAGGRTVAFLDVQLTPDCRLYNLRLVDIADGYRIHAPSAFGSKTATFAPALAAELVRTAIQTLGEKPADDRSHSSAN
jgi:hypothetical protein